MSKGFMKAFIMAGAFASIRWGDCQTFEVIPLGFSPTSVNDHGTVAGYIWESEAKLYQEGTVVDQNLSL
jgi:hypothetical protein